MNIVRSTGKGCGSNGLEQEERDLFSVLGARAGLSLVRVCGFGGCYCVVLGQHPVVFWLLLFLVKDHQVHVCDGEDGVCGKRSRDEAVV